MLKYIHILFESQIAITVQYFVFDTNAKNEQFNLNCFNLLFLLFKTEITKRFW